VRDVLTSKDGGRSRSPRRRGVR